MTSRTSNLDRAAIHHEMGHTSLAPTREPDPLEVISRYVQGDHPIIRDLRVRIARHAAGASPVLLVGETGTGKQVAARALHAAGPRRGQRLVLASVGSLPPTLAQSELFGHRRGAFTGADRDRKGYFKAAHGSTLVLDDIPDFPLAVQAMLLNSVEYGIVRSVGSDVDEFSNVRVVATANRSLATEVEAGRFREDLYYRLSAGEISIPPLRDHLSDLGLYSKDYLLRVALEAGQSPRVLSDGALNALCEHSWPGNVRELQNVLLRAIHSTDAELLLAEHLRREIRKPGAEPLDAPQSDPSPEESRIRAALESARWNVTRAARLLGFGRTKMYERMTRYGIVR